HGVTRYHVYLHLPILLVPCLRNHRYRHSLPTRRSSDLRKVWALTRKLPQGTQTMTSRYGQEIALNNQLTTNPVLMTFTFNQIPSSTVPNCVGICVTDGDNNVIVAQNSNKTKTYQLQFTHDYKQVVEIGRAHV